MATRLDRRRWSYDEFARLPDDGNRYEVINGELYSSPVPSPFHQLALTHLASQLELYSSERKVGCAFLGPIDILFAEGDYLAPDLVFIRRERMGIVGDRAIEATPDLVVEVVSELTAARDRGIKRERYAWFGVPEYWVVDVEQKQIEEYRMATNAEQPEIVRDTLRWRPSPDAPMLEISVAGVCKGLGE